MSLFRSIRIRLTLWYIVVLAVVLAAFSAGIYLTLRQNLSSNLDGQIDNRTEILLGVVSFEEGVPALETNVSPPGTDVDDQLIRLYDANGLVTFDSTAGAAQSLDADVLSRVLAGERVKHTVRMDDDRLRVRIVSVVADGAVAGALEVGLPEDEVTETLRILLVILAVAYPATLALASVGGAFLAGRALSPIDSVTRLAQKISAEDLGQRLRADLPDDEVGRLARTFDEMIDRLDGAFRRQRQFTADASHELRTPLTAIKGQIEVSLNRERDANAYRDALNGVNSEIDRLISLVGSLLTLARADAGEIPLATEAVDIGDLVVAAVEQMTPLAERKGLTVHIERGPAATAIADHDLILQLLLNLLDNAIKYTESGGEVTVSWGVDDGVVQVRVRDSGIGIAPEHIGRVFDRFYRVDTARSRREGGAGLGLSISRWIATAHRGDLSIESAPGRGTTVELRIPRRG